MSPKATVEVQPGSDMDTALARVEQPAQGMALVIERLAANPEVDVVKLEKIIELQERILHHEAKSAFMAAFARMQPELPEVDEKGKIVVKESLRSRYARLEDIQVAVKPVLQKYGFALRHRTEFPDDKKGIIRVVGILSHQQGHSEESIFEAPMDKSDFRTDIQSMGSTVSYGRRYTSIDLLNIVTRGVDDDGATAGRPQPPEGYENWWTDMQAVADSGFKALNEAWGKSSPDLKNFTVKHNNQAWKDLRAKAMAVQA